MNTSKRLFLILALALIVLPTVAAASIDAGICGIENYFARYNNSDVEMHIHSVGGGYFQSVDVPRPIAIPPNGSNYFFKRFMVEYTPYWQFYIQLVDQTRGEVIGETGILFDGDDVNFTWPGADCNLANQPITMVPEGLGNEVHWNEVHWNTPIKSADPEDTQDAHWDALKSIYR